MSFTTKYATPVNIMFDENPTAVATPDNTLHLFALNGIQTKDFEKTVNTERAQTDQRQIIKNPVRFKQLQIGGQFQSTDDFTQTGSKIESLSNPAVTNTLTHLEFMAQSYLERTFVLRNVSNKPTYSGRVYLIDSAGDQDINGSLRIIQSGTQANFRVGDSSSSNFLLQSNYISAANNNLQMYMNANSNSLQLGSSTQSSTNRISLGAAGTPGFNTFETLGSPQTNNIKIGINTVNCTNTVSIVSGSGGSNNLYIGDATVSGQLILSGTQPINQVVTDFSSIGVTNSTIPTTKAVADFVAYGYGAFSMGYSFAGDTGTITTGYRTIGKVVTISPGNYSTLNFTTTASTNTVLQLTGFPAINGAVGLVVLNSYVTFGDGSYSPIVGKKKTLTEIEVTIRGSGFTGMNSFEIPVFSYVAN